MQLAHYLRMILVASTIYILVWYEYGNSNQSMAFQESVPVDEAVKSGGKQGKSWRNVISRTMTRKTSKQVQKALAEEGVRPIKDLPNLLSFK